jgi:hypothetical protein
VQAKKAASIKHRDFTRGDVGEFIVGVHFNILNDAKYPEHQLCQ